MYATDSNTMRHSYAPAIVGQVDLLRIIRLLARHYASCAMSLKVTRSFDAARILVMSAMATIADALVRVQVCGRSSQREQH